jgi:hypothetical protein
MSSYRFYYLNGHDHIIDADWAACSGDAAAIARAKSVLVDMHDCRAIEIWQGTRRIEVVGTAMMESG